MQKSGLAPFTIFYYDFSEKEKGLRGLLSSVLCQPCNQSYSYYATLSTFYSTYHGGARKPRTYSMLLLNLPGQAPIYLIADALDECPNTFLLSHRD